MAIDHRFFSVNPSTAAALAQLTGCELHGDGDRPVTDAAPVSKAGEGALTFLGGAQDGDDMPWLVGSVVVTTAALCSTLPDGVVCLVSDAPRRDFAAALASIVAERQGVWRQHPGGDWPEVEVGPAVIVGDDVEIGRGSVIGAGAVIHQGVRIGRNCRIDANAVLSHCDLGDGVVVGAGSVIGGAGFGFEITPDGPVRLSHVGTVTIGDSSCIGAGCAVDRGTLGPTAIGRQVMIDNLVHIAHNCRIGDRAVLAAQVGLAGGAVIDEGAMLAGQAGVSSQVTVGKGAVVMGQSGVTKDVADNMTVVGFPATEAREAWRERAALRRLIAKSSQRKE
ncbi:MAG: UDP-3-O-(3-hydroxymyristoyl)glucosamine N-acyltransferase [Rhodobiaceae bacterium]|jgi:UDP-3-O-[3-hydroxymyristoyl] glucosamine N-acyltransferase